MNRIKKIVNIRKKLNSGLPTIGSWMQLESSDIGEIMGDAGYDWVALDLEHGHFSSSELTNLIRSIELNNTLGMIRVSSSDSLNVKKALDAGAGGVILPMINSAEALKDIVESCCWPKSGNRGVGFSRANLYGKYFKEYIKEAQAPLIIAQIENIGALQELDNILEVKKLDAIMIGSYDLSASIGKPGEFTSNKYKETVKKIISICRKKHKAFGIHIVDPDPNVLSKRIKNGYQFIAYSIDSVFLNKYSLNPMKAK